MKAEQSQPVVAAYGGVAENTVVDMGEDGVGFLQQETQRDLVGVAVSAKTKITPPCKVGGAVNYQHGHRHSSCTTFSHIIIGTGCSPVHA